MEDRVARVSNSNTVDDSRVFSFGISDTKAGIKKRFYHATFRQERGTRTTYVPEYKEVRNPKYNGKNAYVPGQGGEFPTIHIETGEKVAQENESCPPIFVYVHTKQYDKLKALLDSGYNPNVTSRWSCEDKDISTLSPMHVALDNSDVKAAEMLMQHGYDIFAKPSYGSPAIKGAIEKRQLEILEVMVRYSKDRLETALSPSTAGTRYDLGYTPLVMALQFDQPEAVKILLAAGADPEAEIGQGFTARTFAQTTLKNSATRELPAVKAPVQAPPKRK